MQLYVDLDGVLADFDGTAEKILGRRPDRIGMFDNADWARLSAVPDLYWRLDLLPDAMALWEHVMVHDPIILTGLPRSMPQAVQHKRDWVTKHLGSEVRVDCCFSRDKCKRAAPGDILIDDWEKFRHLWEAAGGVWITHTSAADTIRQLQKHGL